jgi:hypothetical protein
VVGIRRAATPLLPRVCSAWAGGGAPMRPCAAPAGRVGSRVSTYFTSFGHAGRDDPEKHHADHRCVARTCDLGLVVSARAADLRAIRPGHASSSSVGYRATVTRHCSAVAPALDQADELIDREVRRLATSRCARYGISVPMRRSCPWISVASAIAARKRFVNIGGAPTTAPFTPSACCPWLSLFAIGLPGRNNRPIDRGPCATRSHPQ